MLHEERRNMLKGRVGPERVVDETRKRREGRTNMKHGIRGG